jgi:hypothetical protein
MYQHLVGSLFPCIRTCSRWHCEGRYTTVLMIRHWVALDHAVSLGRLIVHMGSQIDIRIGREPLSLGIFPTL